MIVVNAMNALNYVPSYCKNKAPIKDRPCI